VTYSENTTRKQEGVLVIIHAEGVLSLLVEGEGDIILAGGERAFPSSAP
jgi:hypothetical protein